MTDLFSPFPLGAKTAHNRVVLAPLTRCRAPTPQQAPSAVNVEYYAQRSGPTGAGLLITEATQISPAGRGYPNTPGIHSQEQVAGWKAVTEAVHARGSLIYLQLWHVGRVSHNAYQPDGRAPVSSSAIAKSGQCMLPDGTMAPYPTPRAMTVDEIRAVIQNYRKGAENARAAGFDGVELHGANGYLPDQFLRDGVNKRTDEYGGPVENRARFMLEVMRTLVEVWGPGRVGVRLSPSGAFNDMQDSDPRATYGYLLKQLDALPLSYAHIMEAMEGDAKHGPEINPKYESIPVSVFKAMTRHPVITNAGFTLDKAQAYIKEGWADAVAFGIPFIANPDLAERFRRTPRGQQPVLNAPDPSTFYYGGVGPMEKGYTDYPALNSGASTRA